MSTKVVQITNDHIRRGVSRDARRCPTKLALDDAGLGCTSVGSDNFTAAGKAHRLPRNVSAWIKRLDANKRVRPLRFRVKL